jgi:hypothetical protein
VISGHHLGEGAVHCFPVVLAGACHGRFLKLC